MLKATAPKGERQFTVEEVSSLDAGIGSLVGTGCADKTR